MGRTILASCLLFAIRAMIKTTTSEVCQMQVFIRHCVLMKMMATIQLNHLTDYSLLLLNPGHFILPYFISSPCLSYTSKAKAASISLLAFLIVVYSLML